MASHRSKQTESSSTTLNRSNNSFFKQHCTVHPFVTITLVSSYSTAKCRPSPHSSLLLPLALLSLLLQSTRTRVATASTTLSRSVWPIKSPGPGNILIPR
jgi:hypothetical protein